jgi:hypothetical protein
MTVAESTGISTFALKALVNRSVGKDVTADYVQMTTEQLRDPAEKICQRKIQLCGIEKLKGAARLSASFRDRQ